MPTKKQPSKPRTSTNKKAGRGCPEATCCASSERPRSLLTNGKPNPEYHRWWRTTEKGKATVKAWNDSESKRTASRKWDEKHRRQKIDSELARNEESQKKATMRGLPWGVVEDSYLLDNAGGMTIKDIAAELGRSIKSCEIRLFRLRQFEHNLLKDCGSGE